MSRKMLALLASLIILSLGLAACGSTPTAQPGATTSQARFPEIIFFSQLPKMTTALTMRGTSRIATPAKA